MSCGCSCYVSLPHGAMGWSAVCVIMAFLGHTHFLVPWIGLQSVIVAFPGHTHLLFKSIRGRTFLLVDLLDLFFRFMVKKTKKK